MACKSLHIPSIEADCDEGLSSEACLAFPSLDITRDDGAEDTPGRSFPVARLRLSLSPTTRFKMLEDARGSPRSSSELIEAEWVSMNAV
jgi:hypothetical protein